MDTHHHFFQTKTDLGSNLLSPVKVASHKVTSHRRTAGELASCLNSSWRTPDRIP